MTQPAKVQEPSMEEILASIRRIIADDQAKPADVGTAARIDWQAAGAAPPGVNGSSRLSLTPGYPGLPLLAPESPGVTLFWKKS